MLLKYQLPEITIISETSIDKKDPKECWKAIYMLYTVLQRASRFDLRSSGKELHFRSYKPLKTCLHDDDDDHDDHFK